MATKQFSNVSVNLENLPDGRVRVYFILQDWPSIVRKIEYRGAKHIKDEDLNMVTGLRLDAPLNPTMNKLACQAIKRKYKDEMGRPFADCYLLKGDKLGDTEVIFQITEGFPVKISDIQFTGNTFVSGGVLACTHYQFVEKDSRRIRRRIQFCPH